MRSHYILIVSLFACGDPSVLAPGPDGGKLDGGAAVDPCGPSGMGGRGTFQVAWGCFRGCEFGSPLAAMDRLEVTDLEFRFFSSTEPDVEDIVGGTVGAYCASADYEFFTSFGWPGMDANPQSMLYAYWPPAYQFAFSYAGIPGTIGEQKLWRGVAYPL